MSQRCKAKQLNRDCRRCYHRWAKKLKTGMYLSRKILTCQSNLERKAPFKTEMSCHTKSFSDWTSPFRQPQRRRLDGGSLGSCGLLWSCQLRPVQRDPPQRAPEAGEAAGHVRGAAGSRSGARVPWRPALRQRRAVSCPMRAAMLLSSLSLLPAMILSSPRRPLLLVKLFC